MMNLKEVRQNWEKGLEPILEVVTPNNTVYVLLYNSLSPTFRTNYLVHKYFPGKDNYWSLSVVLSNFEHIEEGLEVITKSFMVFMPQE